MRRQQRSLMNIIALSCASILLALHGTQAASRGLLQAPAPAPAASAGPKPAADGVFIITAASATFTNATTLTLEGLTNITQWVKYKPASAGSFQEGKFFSKSLAAPSGKWVDGPQALLTGASGNSTSRVIVELNAPIYYPANNSATLAYRVVSPSNQTELMASGGIVNSALSIVASSSTETNTTATASTTDIMTSVTPGLTLVNATLFVDVTGIDAYTSGAGAGGEKAGLINIGLGWGGWGGYWYGDPYYYGGWP